MEVPARTACHTCSRHQRGGGEMPACGQLLRHLTTGFGQPCGVRWTPPACPLAPSHDGGGVPPGPYQSQPIKGETTYNLLQAPVAEPALVNIDSPQTGGPYLSIEVGHT